MDSSDDETKEADAATEPVAQPMPDMPTKKSKKQAAELGHKVAVTDNSVVVTVELPAIISSMAELSLDVLEEDLNLRSAETDAILLAVPLPEKVDPDVAAAKFSKKKRRLTVTVPRL